MLAHIAEPSFFLLLIGAAVLADVVFAILALPLGIDEKSKRGAATHAAALVKAVLLGKDVALVTFFIQLLLHLTVAPGERKNTKTKGRQNQNNILLGETELSIYCGTLHL